MFIVYSKCREVLLITVTLIREVLLITVTYTRYYIGSHINVQISSFLYQVEDQYCNSN